MAKAVVIAGILIPVNPEDRVVISSSTGSNPRAHSYTIVEVDDLTPDERASVQTQIENRSWG